MSTIIPCLWFDGRAEEAATYYTSVFPDGEITGITHYGPDAGEMAGRVMSVSFRLRGQEFVGLDGGPQFSFSEAVSFQIMCADQDEVDHFWGCLTDGGEESQCGWLKDRFGVSWQVVPSVLPEILGDPDPQRAERATRALMGMRKLDIAALRRAAEG